jgi:hypothetical protein
MPLFLLPSLQITPALQLGQPCFFRAIQDGKEPSLHDIQQHHMREKLLHELQSLHPILCRPALKSFILQTDL